MELKTPDVLTLPGGVRRGFPQELLFEQPPGSKRILLDQQKLSESQMVPAKEEAG